MQSLRWKWIFFAGWLLLVFLSLWFNFTSIDKTAFEMAVTQGRTSWTKDQSYRQWVTDKGGIYAPPSEEYPPNPYLAHIPQRDVVTTEGKKLTLINPAYMIRQVHEIAVLPDAPKEHITSLRSLRPENKPDEWEYLALKKFENGQNEVAELAMLNGRLNMRFMRPMITKEGCLKCHGEQGYKVGDIRGGVSFSIPFKPFLDAAQDQKRFLLIWHFLILLIGIIGTELAFRRILKNELLLRKALEESKVNEEKVRQLNIELEERVVQEVSKSRQKDLMLIQQSRLASMGEMIHNIAHQWRQPLNALAIIMANIQDDYKYNELSEERLAELVSKNRAILEQMSNTIDDFRDFFRSDKEAKQFDITDVIDDTLVLINASFLNNNISVEKRYTKPL